MDQAICCNSTRLIKERMVVSHCRLKSLQYSCLEQIEFILNRLASINNVCISQKAIFSYFFTSNQGTMRSLCLPSKYSNLLVNYLLSSKTATQDAIASIVMLADSFTVDSIAVPRNNTLDPNVLLSLLVKFQLLSLDLSYCQFVDNAFFSKLAHLGNYPALSLRKLVLRGTKITKTDMLYCFTQLQCLDLSELAHLAESSDCYSYRDHLICLFQKLVHLSELNLYATTFAYPQGVSGPIPLSDRSAEFFPPQLTQLQNFVQLDLSRSVEVISEHHRLDQQMYILFSSLSKLHSLQYLDMSFWPVDFNHLLSLKNRRECLEFLGILGTKVLSTLPPNTQLNIFAKEITSLHNEASTINSIQHYGYRRDYVNHIVNHLIEEVDKTTHQFNQPDKMANAMLDLIESYYLFNKSAFPLSIHMPPFLDFTYVISRILDKVLEHLSSSTLKRIVFDFIELARISVNNIHCNNQLLLNIFTVLANFNSVDFSSYLAGYIPDLFHLVCKMFSSLENKNPLVGDDHNLIEISTLILSNLTWMNSLFREDEDLSPIVQTFLDQLIEMMTHFVAKAPADPILGYLGAILMNISCERAGICRWLLSVVSNMNIILNTALHSNCEVVIENLCGCFEHIMNNCLKATYDFGEWENIHVLVENAYMILATNGGLNVDIISSTSATIIYYWYTMEKTNSLPKVTEREATLEMVTEKISQVSDHIKKNFDYVNIEAPLACLESSDINIQNFALWVVHGCLRMNFNKFCCYLGKEHMDRIYALQFSENYCVKQKAELITSLVSSANQCIEL